MQRIRLLARALKSIARWVGSVSHHHTVTNSPIHGWQPLFRCPVIGKQHNGGRHGCTKADGIHCVLGPEPQLPCDIFQGNTTRVGMDTSAHPIPTWPRRTPVHKVQGARTAGYTPPTSSRRPRPVHKIQLWPAQGPAIPLLSTV